MTELETTSKPILPGLTASQTELRHCDKHGEYESEFFSAFGWTACPACTVAEAEQAQADERRRYAKRQFLARLKGCNIPERFMRGAGFGNYEIKNGHQQQKAFEAVSRYAAPESLRARRRDGIGLIMVGGTGTGKTHLAVAVLKSAVKVKMTARYDRASAIGKAFRSSYSSQSKLSETDVMSLFVAPDFLVLDEIDKLKDAQDQRAEHDIMTLFEVLDERYTALKPTIIISNKNAPETAQRLGAPIWDRLSQGAPIVPFGWDSYRQAVDKI